MKTGEAIIDAIAISGAIQSVTGEPGNQVIVWRANSPEQIEAAFIFLIKERPQIWHELKTIFEIPQ